MQDILHTPPEAELWEVGKAPLKSLQSKARPRDYTNCRSYLPKGKTLSLFFISTRRSESRVRATAWLGKDRRGQPCGVKKCLLPPQAVCDQAWSLGLAQDQRRLHLELRPFAVEQLPAVEGSPCYPVS